MNLNTILIKDNLEFRTTDANSVMVSSLKTNPVRISKLGKKILDTIDGRKNVEEIRISLGEEGSEISQNELLGFLEDIARNDFFMNYKSEEPKKRSIFQKLSFIKVFTFDSDEIFKKFVDLRNGQIVKYIIYMAPLIALAGFINVIYFDYNLEGIKSTLVLNLYTFENYVFIVFVLILLSVLKTICHESAHAIMCRYYGYPVRSIGFALYLGMPGFFVDTTNIWIEKNKYKRIAVSLAGPASDFIILSIIILISNVFLLQSEYYDIIIVFVFLAALKSFINFIPFVKFDGYFMLVDLLEMPNLRSRSLKFIYNLFAKEKYKFELNKATKIFLLIFGFLSAVTTVIIIARLFYIFYIVFDYDVY